MTLLLILFNYRINGTTNIVATTSGINLIIGANDDINGTYTNKVFQKGKIGYIENKKILHSNLAEAYIEALKKHI